MWTFKDIPFPFFLLLAIGLTSCMDRTYSNGRIINSSDRTGYTYENPYSTNPRYARRSQQDARVAEAMNDRHIDMIDRQIIGGSMAPYDYRTNYERFKFEELERDKRVFQRPLENIF